MGLSARREREKQVRRQEILDAARRVIGSKGFRGATMEEIAEKADYKPAALYRYFESKDEILASLILALEQYQFEQFVSLAERNDLTPLQKLEEIPDMLCRIYRFDPVVFLGMMHIQASQTFHYMSPETLAQLNEMAAKGIRGLASVFAKGIEQGMFEPVEPLVMADTVWSLFTGVVLWEETKRFFDPKKNFVESTLRSGPPGPRKRRWRRC